VVIRRFCDGAAVRRRQRRALTDQAKHTYEAQVSGYKGVIFLAFEDVEDQLPG